MIEPAIRLRPLTVADLLDEAFRLYRQRFPTLAAISIGAAIPTLAVTLLAGQQNIYGFAYEAITNPGASVQPPASNPFLALLIYPVVLISYPIQWGGLFMVSVWSVLGYQAGPRKVLEQMLRTFLPSIAFAGLYVFGGASLLYCCFPVAFWLGIKLALLYPAFYAERTGVGNAFSRSWRLTDGFFWRTFWLMVALLVLNFALTWSLLVTFYAAAFLIPGLAPVVRGVIVTVGSSLAQVLILPLVTLAITLIYFDLRVRKEALDLDVMAYQIATATQ